MLTCPSFLLIYPWLERSALHLFVDWPRPPSTGRRANQPWLFNDGTLQSVLKKTYRVQMLLYTTDTISSLFSLPCTLFFHLWSSLRLLSPSTGFHVTSTDSKAGWTTCSHGSELSDIARMLFLDSALL